MKLPSIKSKFLAVAVALTMFSTASIAHANNTHSTDRQAKKEARMAKILTMSVEATRTNVNAVQAVQIAQNQQANARVNMVRYSDGSKKVAKKVGKNGMKDNQAKKRITTPAYHVGLVDSDGRRYHVAVDASTGEVLKNEEKKKRVRKNASNKTQNTTDKQRPKKIEPAITILEAMQVAESNVGGEAVSAGLGKSGKMSHKRGHKNRHKRGHKNGHKGGKHAPNKHADETGQNESKINREKHQPSYHVKVVKNGQVNFVKVDGQTGKVIYNKTAEQMKSDRTKRKAERTARRAEHKAKRAERRANNNSAK